MGVKMKEYHAVITMKHTMTAVGKNEEEAKTFVQESFANDHETVPDSNEIELKEVIKLCDDCNYTFEEDDDVYHCDSDDSDICEVCRPLHLEEGCHIEEGFK